MKARKDVSYRRKRQPKWRQLSMSSVKMAAAAIGGENISNLWRGVVIWLGVA
jgi:hypothetical protein